MSELKESEGKKRRFTYEQEDFICWVIGEWYLEWKNKLVNYEDKTHRLGYAKEMLKIMICEKVICGQGEEIDE